MYKNDGTINRDFEIALPGLTEGEELNLQL
jgi:hypothetical protein